MTELLRRELLPARMLVSDGFGPLGLVLAPEMSLQSRKLLVKQDISDLVGEGP